MKHFLKESGKQTPFGLNLCIFLIYRAGMVEWLKEYVIRRQEPVEKLLYAFDVLLVCGSPSSI